MANRLPSLHLCHFVALAVLASSVGCASTPALNKFLLLDLEPEAETVAPLDPNVPHVTVMLIPSNGKTRKARVPVQEGMLVSDVIKQTKATKRFRRETINIMRKTPRDIRPLRMHVNYNQKRQRIAPGSDYALHPGDVIQVVEDKTGAIDDIIGDALGPLGAQAVKQSVPALSPSL